MRLASLASLLALLAGAGDVGEVATIATAPDHAAICRHLLAYYPTPAPLHVAIGTPRNVVLRCQSWAPAGLAPIILTFPDQAAVTWWQSHNPARTVLPGEGPGD